MSEHHETQLLRGIDRAIVRALGLEILVVREGRGRCRVQTRHFVVVYRMELLVLRP